MTLPELTVADIMAFPRQCFSEQDVTRLVQIAIAGTGRTTVTATDILGSAIPDAPKVWTLAQAGVLPDDVRFQACAQVIAPLAGVDSADTQPGAHALATTLSSAGDLGGCCRLMRAHLAFAHCADYGPETARQLSIIASAIQEAR